MYFEASVKEVGVNPARAGMIPCLKIADSGTMGKPRASGDDPYFIRPRRVNDM